MLTHQRGDAQSEHASAEWPKEVQNGEHRSVVLVSKRDHHEGGDEDSAKPYSLMPRQFLKVFVVSKVIPQNTSLSKINATWLRHLFPTPSNKPVLGRTSSTRGGMASGAWGGRLQFSCEVNHVGVGLVETCSSGSGDMDAIHDKNGLVRTIRVLYFIQL